MSTNEEKIFEAEEKKTRADIARRLVYACIYCVIGLALIVIVAGAFVAKENFKENTQLVFTSLLPLLGTWVGTILAFYFSKDNFQSASQSFINTVKELTPLEKLRSLPVKDNMIPLASIKAGRIGGGQTEKDVKLEDLKKLLGMKITRIPILNDKDIVRYVIHQSYLYKFIAEQSIAQGPAFQFATATLEDFLKDSVIRDYVEKTIAFVGVGQTLADAKLKMDGVANCQDVFVTEQGDPKEPVVGWLTNVDITKQARV
jgi:hypothetical protein